jgi:hypothetical protein
LALQGTLDTFSLPDVLRLLATTSKTGRLRIEGDRGRGSVWLSDGGIVDVDAERAVDGTPTDEVVFELMRFGAGSFVFDADDRAVDAGDPEDVETLLRRANSLLSEWTELEAVVPSLEHQVSLATDLSVDEVTIDADHWRSLVAVASGRTVGELATSLGLTELGVSRAVRDLVDLGVADVDSPGAAPEPTRRPPSTGRDLPSRGPTAPHPETEGVGARGRQASLTGETPRAGWLTGEVPAVPPDRHTTPASNGQLRASLDDTIASPAPAPAPAEPPAKGGRTSRLGRNRSANASSRTPEPPTTGSTPPVTNGSPRQAGRTPGTPPPRANETGQHPSSGGTDAGPTGRRDTGSARSTSPSGPTRPGSPSRPASSGPSRGASPSSRPASPGRSRPSSPAGPGSPGGAPPGAGPSPFDGGRLGPPPSARDTGQIRPIMPSSLPPDLHWAADDTGGGPTTSPFSGLSNLGPSRPAPADGEIAPHVAAMSPEARSAVQATVGNTGGSAGGRGPGQGEDIAQRGRLISFLSTVR